jgi:hypothetical protein
MNMETLSIVKFGDAESLGEFLFENGVQHYLFWETLTDAGLSYPKFPITDANIQNLDDWLLAHQVEHQAIASYLGLDNPFNMLDVDFNVEEQFYDWLGTHYNIHQQIASTLGLT